MALLSLRRRQSGKAQINGMLMLLYVCVWKPFAINTGEVVLALAGPQQNILRCESCFTRHFRVSASKADAYAVSPGSQGPRGADAGALYLPKPATEGRAVSSQGQAPVDPQ